jgi:sec-independent protein translocase protein TatA
VLFGGSQLPKLAKNLGKAQQEFKSGLAEGQKDADKTETKTETKTDSGN